MELTRWRIPRLATRWLVSTGLLLCALGAGLVAARLAPGLSDLASYGYAGIFALMVVSGGSILFPLPGLAGVATAGMLWNPLVVGIVAGLGNATGEFTGYVAGLSGRKLVAVPGGPAWRRVEAWLRRFGLPALIVFAALPNPLFDVVGLAAGYLRIPAWKFWVGCAVGNSAKYTAVALLGNAAVILLA